jgi:hypothetical protein
VFLLCRQFFHKSFIPAFPAMSPQTTDVFATAHATGKETASQDSKEAQSKYKLDGIEDDAATNEYVDGIDGYTRRDQRNMQRMGKQQELMRNFRPLSALSFTVLLQATWEFLLM